MRNLRLTIALAGVVLATTAGALWALPSGQERESARPRVERDPSGQQAAPRQEAPPRSEAAPNRSDPARAERAFPRDPESRRPVGNVRGGDRDAQPAANQDRGGSGRERVSRREGDARGAGPDQAVPRGSRPRGDRPITGQAIPRADAPIDVRSSLFFARPWYFRSYYPYGYGAFGLGYFYYDPYWSGYPSYGYPGYGYPGYGYGGYGYSSYGYSSYGYGYAGALRLKMKPREAQVFVDGYYVGLVDDFDGLFQRLNLDGGPHRVEIRSAGYEPLTFEVRIQPGETITYRGELRRP